MALASVSLVRSHLEHASASWDPHTARDIEQSEGVQRRGAGFVHKDYCRTTSISQLLSDLSWSHLSPRRQISHLVIFYMAFTSPNWTYQIRRWHDFHPFTSTC